MNTSRIPVLMYHRLGEAMNSWEAKYCVSPARFEKQMQLLAAHGFRAISIDSFFSWLDGNTELEEGSFLLTFDDGFQGIHEFAAPVLETLGWPATVFLVSALTGQEDQWCATENPSGATYPLLDSGQIHALRKRGFSFHSHTRHHRRLTELNDVELEDALRGSRTELEEQLGDAPQYLAYPYGLHDDRVVDFTRTAGYQAAFSVRPGFNRRDIDRFRIRRLDVFGTDSPKMLLRKIKLGTNDGSFSNYAKYFLNQVLQRVVKP